MPELSGPAITALRTRQRFTEGDLSAYITKGGSYVLATSGAYSDDGKARDLLLILPVDLGKGRLVRLWPALHPQFVPSIEEALRPTCEFSLRCRTRATRYVGRAATAVCAKHVPEDGQGVREIQPT